MHSTKSFSKSSKEGRGDTSAWTDTPSERAQKAKMKYVLYIYIYIYILVKWFKMLFKLSSLVMRLLWTVI